MLSAIRLFTFFAICLWGLTFSHAGANDKDLGLFKDWQAHSFIQGGGKVCNVWSVPKSSKGNYTRRGRIYAYVTHHAKYKKYRQVSFELGYTAKKGYEPKLTIDNQSWTLFTDGSLVFSHAEDDAALIKAMRRGQKMTLVSVSSRGTTTTDVFSLSGVTKAMQAIDKACGLS